MQTTRPRTLLAGAVIWALASIACAAENAPGSLIAPAASNSSSLVSKAAAGEDFNKNGVRDDVEQYLAKNVRAYQVYNAYRDLAKQLQRVIVEVPSGKTTASSVAKDIEIAMLALGKVTAFFTEAPIKIGQLEELVFNTKERKSAYETFSTAFYRGE